MGYIVKNNVRDTTIIKFIEDDDLKSFLEAGFIVLAEAENEKSLKIYKKLFRNVTKNSQDTKEVFKMSEIMWLETKQSHSSKPEGLDVYVCKSTIKKTGKVQTYIYFYNGSDQKVSHTNHLLIGLNHERIFLKEADVGVGKKISVSNKSKRISVLRDFDNDFEMSMYEYFKLQYSEVHQAWFISESGRLK